MLLAGHLRRKQDIAARASGNGGKLNSGFPEC
jgi:hypothetical protein